MKIAQGATLGIGPVFTRNNPRGEAAPKPRARNRSSPGASAQPMLTTSRLPGINSPSLSALAIWREARRPTGYMGALQYQSGSRRNGFSQLNRK